MQQMIQPCCDSPCPSQASCGQPSCIGFIDKAGHQGPVHLRTVPIGSAPGRLLDIRCAPSAVREGPACPAAVDPKARRSGITLRGKSMISKTSPHSIEAKLTSSKL